METLIRFLGPILPLPLKIWVLRRLRGSMPLVEGVRVLPCKGGQTTCDKLAEALNTLRRVSPTRFRWTVLYLGYIYVEDKPHSHGSYTTQLGCCNLDSTLLSSEPALTVASHIAFAATCARFTKTKRNRTPGQKERISRIGALASAIVIAWGGQPSSSTAV
jgi:hypothetical protein